MEKALTRTTPVCQLRVNTINIFNLINEYFNHEEKSEQFI